MHWAIVPLAALTFVGGPALAAPARTTPAKAAPAKASPAPEPRPEFTTRSPAGNIYRRAPATPVAPLEVVVARRPAAPTRQAPQPDAIGSRSANTSARGAMNGGVGVNVAAPPSANRQGVAGGQ
jgi:hypothetical protein